MPNRNNAPVLELVMDRLATHTQYPAVELVVVDDGSTDGSQEILRRWRHSQRFAGDFRLIDHAHTAGGVVDALNTGLRVATGELVVQLDADATIETPEWLEKMVSFFVSDARIGAITVRVVTDAGLLDSCGIEVIGPAGYYNRGAEISEAIGQRTSHRKAKLFREDEWPACEELAEVDGGTGVCLMYRRDAVLDFGGYDRGFAPVWLDDLDLTISLRRAGLKIFYLPDVRVVHHLGKRNRSVNQPRPSGITQRSARQLRQGVGSLLPEEARAKLVHALGWDQGPSSQRRWIKEHFRYWQSKWGWNMLNPNMEAIYGRWGDTEICWRLNQGMRDAGEKIITAFEFRAPEANAPEPRSS
jgi:GT2 family glycosyltransferase